MRDKTVIVTGGNAGLGYRCAENIARADPAYHLVLACRSKERGTAAAEALRAETGNPHVEARELDLASLDSVRTFARTAFPPLAGIVCNAGVSAAGVPGVARTADGVEPIFAVNHLGHFLLTTLLLDRVEPGGRIVFVTSDLHDPPRFFPAKVGYDGAAAIAGGRSGMPQYCVSKLCNLYCAYELDRRLKEAGRGLTDGGDGIMVNAFNPGAMADTGFLRPSGNPVTRAAVRLVGGLMSTFVGKPGTAAKSGAALAALITDPAYARVSGAYVDRGEITRSSPLSYDRGNARDLWETSVALTTR